MKQATSRKMISTFFTNMEVANELGIDVGMAKDLIDGKGEWLTEDIYKLLARLAKKLETKYAAN